MSRRDHQLGGGDVLPQRPHVVVRRDGGPDLDCRVVDLVDDLDLDNGVEAVRHGVTSVYPGGLFPHGKPHGGCLGRPHGVPRAYGDPVHRGGVVVGR